MQYKRIMGLDYGDARIGIAFSDLLCTIASPYDTLCRKTLAEDLDYFKNLVTSNDVGLIVIGLAYNMDGSEGKRVEVTKEFGGLLQKELGIPVQYVDERLSSVEAEDLLRQAHVPPIKRKGLLDKISASIILQNYLNMK